MIEIRKLHAHLSETPILADYSLTIGKGEVLAILGANGVGKTTLLRCLTGLLKPSAGTVAVHGRIGYVPQLFHATFAFSVMDMVLMGRARQIGLFGAPRTKDYAIATEMLERMQVADLRDRPFNALSGGQRQLVVIAQALASECEIMILDEPCSALDYKNQSIVIATLRRLNAELGLTVIFTTHAPQHGLEIATHALLMKSRDRYSHGTVADVLTAEQLSDLYEVPIAKAAFSQGGKFTFAPYYAA